MKILNSSNAPRPIGPYSQGIEVDAFVFLSGQIGLDPGTGEIKEGFEQQTRQVMDNISRVLETAGCSFANVVKSTVYLRNMGDFSQFNQIYAEFMKGNVPARTTVEVSSLPRNALIEIEILAHK